MMLCASHDLLDQLGPLETVAELRRAPRLAFSDAVSAGAWTLVAPDGRSHVIDGPIRMTANNMEMLLAAALRGTGVAYGPSFVFDADIASGQLIALLPDHRTADLTIHAVYPSNRHIPAQAAQLRRPSRR